MGNTKKKTHSFDHLKDDTPLSKNHHKSVRYRKRLAEEQEAQQEIEEFDQDLEQFYGNYGGTVERS